MRISDWSSDVCSSDLNIQMADNRDGNPVKCRVFRVSVVDVKDLLHELVAQALLDLKRDGVLAADLHLPECVIERSRSREHGDYGCNVAMQLDKLTGSKTSEVEKR